MYYPIEDHAIIGNLRSAVLVSKNGTIDWAPVPFIDSPTVFASILDDEKGGFWSIRPKEKYSVSQKYIDNTNVLVTEFTTEKGVVELIDFLPIEEEGENVGEEEDTTFRVHRKVKCMQGSVELEMVFEPRLDYARGGDQISSCTGGVYIENGDKKGVLVSKISMNIEEDRVIATKEMQESETEFFIFRYNTSEIVFYGEDESHHEAELEQTISYWRNWVHGYDVRNCPVKSRWHNIVTRSALVLKILFFEPVGTVAAAATTSLPEDVGGVRNWDYRLTWLRDSSFIFQVLFRLGHFKEAEKYIEWFVDMCYRDFHSSEDVGELKVVYGLRKGSDLEEVFLTHLSGYKNSRPVRVGNDAYRQRGLDVYGSVFDMIWQLHVLKGPGSLGDKEWYVLRILADFVAANWNKPDEGLWEVRGGRRHFVYSKVMCWVALDRAIKLAYEYNFKGDTENWREQCESIKKEVMRRGWSEELGSFTQSFDSSELDAATLLFPLLGFIEGDDPKMVSTIQAVRYHLGCDNGLLKRYTSNDGLPGEEGAFLLSSFWLVDALVLAGEREEAEIVFENVIAKANHVGLFSEEIDEKTGAFLGNYPQAYTHIGIINSAFALTEAPSTKKDKSN